MNTLDRFYLALGKTANEFNNSIVKDFIPSVKRSRITGGMKSSKKTDVLQEAVDALEIYAKICYRDGYLKRQAFYNTMRAHYGHKALPEPSRDVVALVHKHMRMTEAKFNILMAKFCLLDYWCCVAEGRVEPKYPQNGSHWAMHEFLNFSPKKVRPILELMIDDAKSILNKKAYEASFEKWRESKAERSMIRNKSEMADVIQAEATLSASVGMKGTFEVEYKGFKLNADAALVARANAQAKGEIRLTPDMLSANAHAGVDVTVRATGNVNVDVLDILQIEAGLEGIAGALAEAGLEMEVSATGAKILVSAEAFAGLKLTGTAKSTLKVGGREVASATAEGSLTAGLGASGSAGFSCGLFGKVSLSAKAGITVGVGAEGGLALGIDFHNISWASANMYFEWLNRMGFKRNGKVWILPLEESHKMAAECREVLGKLMVGLYSENDAEIKQLEAWHRLESRVAKAVHDRYPDMNKIKSELATA